MMPRSEQRLDRVLIVARDGMFRDPLLSFGNDVWKMRAGHGMATTV